MSRVFIVITEFMQANNGELFVASNDDSTKYYCVQNPEIIVDIDTIIFYLGTYFLEVPQIDALHKLAAIARKDFDLVGWVPVIGDYFTGYDNNLNVYQVVSISDPNADYMLVAGDTISGDLVTVNLDTLTNDFIQVLWDEGSGSGSGS